MLQDFKLIPSAEDDKENERKKNAAQNDAAVTH